AAMQKLMLYSWPGNVRELENAIEKAVVLSNQDMITPDLLPTSTESTEGQLKPLTEAKEEFERNYLKEVLQLTSGNISRASQTAGRYRADFYKIHKKHGLHPGDAKEEKDTDSAESAKGPGLPRELSIANPVRTIRFLAEPLPPVGLVLAVIAFEPHDLAVPFKRQDMGRDAVQEPAVVAARHTATAEPLEPFLQGPQGIHVQVVGRFVEQQQIGPFLEHACEVHAVALAAREILHLLLLIGTGKIKAPDIGPRIDFNFAERDGVFAVRDHCPDRLVAIQHAVLVHVADLDRLADPDRAGVRLLLADDQLEQGGLARAVRPDQADDPAPRQVDAQVLEQQLVAVGFAQVLGFHHEVAETRTGRDVNLQVFGQLVLLLAEQLLVAREAGFALGVPAL